MMTEPKLSEEGQALVEEVRRALGSSNQGSGVVYLDYTGAGVAAPSQVLRRTLNEQVTNINPNQQVGPGLLLANPHSGHRWGLDSRQLISRVRQQVLEFFGATEEYDVVFTGGCTAALKLVADSFAFWCEQPVGEGNSSSQAGFGLGAPTFAYHRFSHNSVVGMRESVGGGSSSLGGPGKVEVMVHPFLTLEEYHQWRTQLSTVSLAAEGLETANRGEEAGHHSHDHSHSVPPAKVSPQHLVVFPLECNFSGIRFPLKETTRDLKQRRAVSSSGVEGDDDDKLVTPAIDPSVCVLVDGAAAAGRFPIALDGSEVDLFVCSFYKIFGFPTGVGALLVRKATADRFLRGVCPPAKNASAPTEAACSSKGSGHHPHRHRHSMPPPTFRRGKRYFGGGTVTFVDPFAVGADSYSFRSAAPHEYLEDGTPNYYGISMLPDGFEVIRQLGGVVDISARIDKLRSYAVSQMKQLLHGIGMRALVRIYDSEELRGRTAFLSTEGSCAEAASSPRCDSLMSLAGLKDGASIAFSLVDGRGNFIGHALVEELANLHGIFLRGGCFCNPGACSLFLGLTSESIRSAAAKGHVCWDDRDLVDGHPTGCLRISFGAYSNVEDVDRFIHFLRTTFLETGSLQRHLDDHIDKVTAPSRGADIAIRTAKFYRIRRIEVFPIKGVQGLSVSEWPVTQRGLLWDREWAIVEAETGEAIIPKKNLKITTLRIESFDPVTGVMTLSSPHCATPITANLCAIVSDSSASSSAHSTSAASALVRGRVVKGEKVGGAPLTSWLSKALGVSCFMIRSSAAELSTKKPRGDQTSPTPSGDGSSGGGSSSTSFNNTGSFLVISDASHRIVEDALPAKDKGQVTIGAYRANLVLSSVEPSNTLPLASAVPFEELQWKEIQIPSSAGSCSDSLPSADRLDTSANVADVGGMVVLRSEGPCHRCVQVGVRQNRQGAQSSTENLSSSKPTPAPFLSPEPLATIARLCRQMNMEKPVFGQMFAVAQLPQTRKAPNLHAPSAVEAVPLVPDRSPESNDDKCDRQHGFTPALTVSGTGCLLILCLVARRWLTKAPSSSRSPAVSWLSAGTLSVMPLALLAGLWMRCRNGKLVSSSHIVSPNKSDVSAQWESTLQPRISVGALVRVESE